MAIQYACARCHDAVVSDPGMPATCTSCGLAGVGAVPPEWHSLRPEPFGLEHWELEVA